MLILPTACDVMVGFLTVPHLQPDLVTLQDQTYCLAPPQASSFQHGFFTLPLPVRASTMTVLLACFQPHILLSF